MALLPLSNTSYSWSNNSCNYSKSQRPLLIDNRGSSPGSSSPQFFDIYFLKYPHLAECRHSNPIETKYLNAWHREGQTFSAVGSKIGMSGLLQSNPASSVAAHSPAIVVWASIRIAWTDIDYVIRSLVATIMSSLQFLRDISETQTLIVHQHQGMINQICCLADNFLTISLHCG